MFTISTKFLGQQPPRAAYSRMPIDEIYDYLSWEADLTIIHENQILFSEEVAIIEFYWYLYSWYHRYLTGHNNQFVYPTVEHTEPILVFSPQPNHYWKIDSIWKRCDEPVLIKEEILHSEVHQLLERMMTTIEI